MAPRRLAQWAVLPGVLQNVLLWISKVATTRRILSRDRNASQMKQKTKKPEVRLSRNRARKDLRKTTKALRVAREHKVVERHPSSDTASVPAADVMQMPPKSQQPSVWTPVALLVSHQYLMASMVFGVMRAVWCRNDASAN